MEATAAARIKRLMKRLMISGLLLQQKRVFSDDLNIFTAVHVVALLEQYDVKYMADLYAQPGKRKIWTKKKISLSWDKRK